MRMLLYKLAWMLLLVAAPGIQSTYAQRISAFDGATPAGIAPGTPAGSYPLSGFEHYNPFNGGFAPVLPLYHVGGRGEAGIDLVWNFQPNWAAYKQLAGSSAFLAIDPYPSNNIAGVNSYAFGLGSAGAVYARTGASNTSCGTYYPTTPASTVTRIIYVTGTGTEVDLIDQQTNGAVYTVPNPCSTQWTTANAGRGTAFQSVDGSKLQFTADTAVLEKNPAGNQGSAAVSGYLRFSNGITYRIDNSNVSWIKDRNGNMITLSYASAPLVSVNWYFSVYAPTQITDPNGRVIRINYNDSSCGGCATIAYPGAGGATRVIQVGTTGLGNALRSGYALATIDQLFPGTGQPTSYNYTPAVANYAQFPDGSRFSFQYNSYGELARDASHRGSHGVRLWRRA